MLQHPRYLLSAFILAAILWTGTFFHDFCETFFAGEAGCHHCHVPTEPTRDSFSVIDSSINHIEHCHSPAVNQNTTVGKRSVTDLQESPSEYGSLGLVLPNSLIKLTPNIRQRPPPERVPTSKVFIFILHQALLC